MNEDWKIRKAQESDIDAITELEAQCFPPAEAATRDTFAWRLKAYPEHFYVLEADGKIVSMINGPVVEEKDLLDEMYASPEYCNEQGKWQMIFGVATHPDYRRRGYAGKLIGRLAADASMRKLSGLVLTCKDYNIRFYEGFGFVDEGVSGSEHGGAVWHQMRMNLWSNFEEEPVIETEETE